MAVRELKEALQEASDDDLVVLASDEEGNSFSPLAAIALGAMYNEEERELIDAGYTQDDLGSLENGDVTCIVLWPTH